MIADPERTIRREVRNRTSLFIGGLAACAACHERLRNVPEPKCEIVVRDQSANITCRKDRMNTKKTVPPEPGTDDSRASDDTQSHRQRELAIQKAERELNKRRNEKKNS